MANGQPMKTKDGSESPVGISGDLIKSAPVENTENRESKTLPPLGMTATTPNVSKKTSKTVDLQELKSKAGLVAGALADWQTAGGLVAYKNMTLPSGGQRYVKIYLVADGMDLTLTPTQDGLDFNLVAKQPEPSGSE